MYLDRRVSCIKVSNSKRRHSFFGYYNITPVNKNGNELFCEVKTKSTRGSLFEKVKIYHKESQLVEVLCESNSWNWQQGCMLQWIRNSESTIIYNDFLSEKSEYVAKIFNIFTKEMEIIDKPIYTLSSSENIALTLNFDRLALMRPDYGYFNKKLEWDNLPPDSEDGIWLIDLKENISRLIISLENLKKYCYVSTMDGAKHKVNHIDISPDGKRFIFLHRWIGYQGRYMRLILANIDGTILKILNGDIMTSHSCWWGNNKIISFCYTSEYGNSYVEFNIDKNSRKLLSKKLPTCDGHPSISPNGEWMIFDTYPGFDRMSSLYLYHLESDNLICVGQFYQPLKFYGEARIDLHPKWNNKGDKVYFESGHNNYRTLYYVDLSKIVKAFEID